MKMEKLREMNRQELERELATLADNKFRLKIKLQTKQVENTAQLSGMRRDIARIQTLLREMVRQGVNTTAAAQQDKK